VVVVVVVLGLLAVKKSRTKDDDEHVTHMTLTLRNLSLQVNCLYFNLLYLGVRLFWRRKVELALDGF
jgi:hypothetical protein